MRFGLRFGFGLGSQRGGGITDAVFTITGTGDTASTLSLFYPASENGKVITATGAVKFGAAGDETTHTITGNATNAIKVWCPNGQTGTMVLPNTYTRFSANTSDTAASNGWVTQAGSPSLAMDIGSWPAGLITFNCSGVSTISGKLPHSWGTLKHFTSWYNNLSGDLPSDWETMNYFLCAGSNTISGNLPSDWGTLKTFQVEGYNKISGNLPSDWKIMNYFLCAGSNTISGNLPVDWKSVMFFYCAGSNTISGISAGTDAFTATDMQRIYLDPLTGTGLSVNDQRRILILMSTKTSWSSPKTIGFYAPCASMADTADDGIWKYSGTPTPMAAAVKVLVKTHGVTITLPGVNFSTGAGLPAGFTDWLAT